MAGEVVVHALLCADRVIVENNGKKGIIGVFDRLALPKLPAPSPPWFVFAQLANITGKHSVVFNLVNDETTEVAFSVSGDVDVPEDKDTVDLHIMVGGFRIARYGTYNLLMNVDGSIAHGRTLHVVNPVPEKSE